MCRLLSILSDASLVQRPNTFYLGFCSSLLNCLPGTRLVLQNPSPAVVWMTYIRGKADHEAGKGKPSHHKYKIPTQLNPHTAPGHTSRHNTPQKMAINPPAVSIIEISVELLSLDWGACFAYQLLLLQVPSPFICSYSMDSHLSLFFFYLNYYSYLWISLSTTKIFCKF